MPNKKQTARVRFTGKEVCPHDTNNQCQIHQLAFEQKSRYDSILKHSFEEIYIIDAATLRFLEVSKGALVNLGYTLEEMQGMTPVDIKPKYSHDACLEAFEALLDGGNDQIAALESQHLRKDGSVYDVDLRVQYSNAKVPVFIAMITDTTERNQYEAELKALAFRDAGTDLYNRRYFLEHMEGTINHVNRIHSSVGLILIDMDDFSEVNNTHGHLAGDYIIKEFAAAIKHVFSRKTDVVARYGGDEFVVMCIDNTEAALVKKCKELIRKLNKPLYFKGNEITQTASIGICVRGGDDTDITCEELISGADSAMYEVKAKGKNAAKVCKKI